MRDVRQPVATQSQLNILFVLYIKKGQELHSCCKHLLLVHLIYTNYGVVISYYFYLFWILFNSSQLKTKKNWHVRCEDG